MEFFCAPYGNEVALDSQCFSNFVYTFAESVFFGLFIGFEYFFVVSTQSCERFSLWTVLAFVPITCFLLLTLVLFYIPAELVSVGQVTSVISQLCLWTLVMSSYSSHFDKSAYSKSSLYSIKFLVAGQFFSPVFKTYALFLSNYPVNGNEILLFCTQVLLNFFIFFFAVFLFLFENHEKTEVLLPKNVEKAFYEPTGILKKLTMYWIWPLIKLGNTSAIQNSDIPPISKTEHSEYQSSKLQNYIDSVYNSTSSYSLLLVLFKCYLREILAVTALGSVLIVLDFTSPIFVKLLENYLSSDQPLWRGCALITYMLLCKILQTLLTNYHSFLFRLLSFHIESAISTEIFKKLLKLPASSISESIQGLDPGLSSGKILNLLSSDTGQLTTGITDSMKLFLLPFTCSLGFYLMFISIGVSGGITGTSIIIVLLILNTIIGKQSTHANKRLMETKDHRIKLCNELLSNIRVLKIFNWELKVSEKVLKARDKELEQQTIILLWFLVSIFLNWGTQDYMAAGVISTMAISGEILTPGNVYAGLAAMKVLNTSIFVLPPIINSLIRTRVSVARIQGYLRIPNQERYIEYNTSVSAVSIKNASFIRKENKTTNELASIKRVLKDVSFDIGQGELIAIVGKVASGKSSLLQVLVQNIEFLKDPEAFIRVKGSVSYCSQEPWIQNKSIRDNILFGKTFVEEKYWQVIRVCMLDKDLKMLSGGDLTEIGEKGINLSGGQKARINIARAVYADTDILLFDDPMASLDQYVSKSLFEECIYKYLKGKTRVLVTNNQQYLSHVDRIFVMKSGKIIQIGTFSDLITSPGYFRDKFMIELQQTKLSNTQSNVLEDNIQSSNKALISNEDRVVGQVKLSIYKIYYKLSGTWAVVLGVFIMICWQGVRMFTDFYLAFWTTESESEQMEDLVQNVLVFIFGCILVNLLILGKTFNSFYSGLRASRKLFVNMVGALVDAPVNLFYDVNPMGRIINRMTGDMNTLDYQLVYVSYWALTQIFNVIMVVSFCIATVPQVLVVVPVAAYLGFKVQKFYLASSREIIRLNSMSKSPIIQFFSETMSGLSTIRAFNYEENFFSHFCSLINTNIGLSICDLGCTGWITITLELVFSLILATTSFFIIQSRNSLDAGLAGVCLLYCLNLPQSIYYLIMSLSSVENSMVSAERVHNLSKIPSELPRCQALDQSLVNWPSSGKIEFCQFSARYRPQTEVILKSLSFTINPQEKVAVMGRTGSGKSSIVNSLLRMIEGEAGCIFIDGVNIADLGLDFLRQKICVVLQEPALFEGTLKENIDLLGIYQDDDIENIVKIVGLDLGFNALNMIIKENANNLSVGQKQLVCIARALLKDCKIVAMDEATASIDFKTDKMLQEVVKERMKDKTVLSIVHRMENIKNFDRILVMEQGKVAEFDTYEALISNKSYFWNLSGNTE